MIRLTSATFIATFAALAFSVPASAIDIAQLRKIIGDEQGNAMPGCAAGIFENGKTIVATGVGGADVATRRGIDADTQFYAASVSKQFTALALAQLVVAGKVSMDDDIRKFFPELAYDHPVTVAMVMHHIAGIPDVLQLVRLAGHESASTVSRAEALKLLLAVNHGDFEPGTRYSYSNGGYLLLSEIVERVSRMPFHEYVARNIFEKLGMKRSFILHGQFPSDPNVAHAYVMKDGKPVQVDTYPLFGGSGGVIFTINDIAKYDRDINVEHKVWTPEVAKILLAPGKFPDGTLDEGSPGHVYAGGVSLGDGWVAHTGGAEGFINIYARFPARKIGIAFLCNNRQLDVTQSLNVIHHMTQQVATALGDMPALDQPYPGLQALPSPEGRFASPDLPVFYDVKQNAKGLAIDVVSRTDGTHGAGFTLTRQRDGSFMSSERMRVTFDHARKGFRLDDGAIWLSFERVKS